MEFELIDYRKVLVEREVDCRTYDQLTSDEQEFSEYFIFTEEEKQLYRYKAKQDHLTPEDETYLRDEIKIVYPPPPPPTPAPEIQQWHLVTQRDYEQFWRPRLPGGPTALNNWQQYDFSREWDPNKETWVPAPLLPPLPPKDPMEISPPNIDPPTDIMEIELKGPEPKIELNGPIPRPIPEFSGSKYRRTLDPSKYDQPHVIFTNKNRREAKYEATKDVWKYLPKDIN